MADNDTEVEVLDAVESEVLSRDEIVEKIRALPDPIRGYCSWIFAGACDLLKELLAGRDAAEKLSEIAEFSSSDAEQLTNALSAVPSLRQKGLAFERNQGHLDVDEEFADDLTEAIEGSVIITLLADIQDAIMVLLDEKDPEGDYFDVLQSSLVEMNLPEEKKARFSRVFSSLGAVLNDLFIADMEDEVLPLASVPDSELERLIGKLPAKQRALYAFMHNRLIGIILAKTDDRLSVAEELLQEEVEDEGARQTMLEQISWSASLASRIQPSAERFAPKGNKTAEELIEPFVNTVEGDLETYQPLADGILTLYCTATALEHTLFPGLSEFLADGNASKADVQAAELAEAFLVQSQIDRDAGDEPPVLCNNGEAIWRTLRANLSAVEAHRIGEALKFALYPLTKLGDDAKIYKRFLEVGNWPDDETFNCAQECLVPLMTALCAYHETEGTVQDAVLRLLYPTTEAEAERACMDFDKLVKRLPAVLKGLPDDFREDVIMSFSASAHLGQAFLQLPKKMRLQLYEGNANEPGILDFLDVQMQTLVTLGLAAQLLQVPENSE